jgi:hypothetical protein
MSRIVLNLPSKLHASIVYVINRIFLPDLVESDFTASIYDYVAVELALRTKPE